VKAQREQVGGRVSLLLPAVDAVDELADLDGPTVRYVEARPPDAHERIAAALALLLRTGALDA
jgi:hypothetical protein